MRRTCEPSMSENAPTPPDSRALTRAVGQTGKVTRAPAEMVRGGAQHRFELKVTTHSPFGRSSETRPGAAVTRELTVSRTEAALLVTETASIIPEPQASAWSVALLVSCTTVSGAAATAARPIAACAMNRRKAHRRTLTPFSIPLQQCRRPIRTSCGTHGRKSDWGSGGHDARPATSRTVSTATHRPSRIAGAIT